MKKTNYHTHHYRCKHAVGEIKDYVAFAVKRGLSELGISCHLPYKDGRFPGDRMNYSDLSKYFEEIDQAGKTFKELNLLKSLECEYFEDSNDYYLELKGKTDYLILGQHYIIRENGEAVDAFFISDKKTLYLYRDNVVKGIESGMFDFLAHPDVFMASYPEWDEHCEKITEDILASCRKYNMIIEYNSNGFRRNRKYPHDNFWRYVSDNYREIKVLVNSDAHFPEALDDEFIKYSKDRVEAMGLNLIEILPIRKR